MHRVVIPVVSVKIHLDNINHFWFMYQIVKIGAQVERIIVSINSEICCQKILSEIGRGSSKENVPRVSLNVCHNCSIGIKN